VLKKVIVFGARIEVLHRYMHNKDLPPGNGPGEYHTLFKQQPMQSPKYLQVRTTNAKLTTRPTTANGAMQPGTTILRTGPNGYASTNTTAGFFPIFIAD